ncbi:MAG: FHA domain-containing protein [Candidatus Acidiferrales bacterium]|jgi:pSer/pThr/pTyr-binding forkhead associated (FHA) protein
MARLILKFEGAVIKEVPLGNRPVTVGRAPDNDIPIDNLAVSNNHARIYEEAGRLVVEDLTSLNGTFVNGLRVERAMLNDGDSIEIGKHNIVVDQEHDAAVPLDSRRKVSAPKVDETMVLDTKMRREMFEQAAALGERSQISPGRMRVPTLVVLGGRTDRKEYQLTDMLTVIGKSPMASIKLRGWFAPNVAAQIHKHDDGYYLGLGDRVPSVNGMIIVGPTRLKDGDEISVGRVRLSFLYRV